MNKKPTIGIIGVGAFTMDFAQRSAVSGYKVLLSTTECLHTIKDSVEKMQPLIKTVSINQAILSGDIILLFLPREKIAEVVKYLPELNNKILVCHQYFITKDIHALKNQANNNSCQLLTSLLPESTIIKIFTPLELEPTKNTFKTEKKTIYFSTNHPEAEEKALFFLSLLNFTVSAFTTIH